jgi:hypothetical protein
MTVIGRNANDNMYPISIAVVEAKTRESWIWFLKALLADLGPSGPHGWAFISDRLNVSISILLSFFLFSFFFFFFFFFLIYMSCK